MENSHFLGNNSSGAHLLQNCFSPGLFNCLQGFLCCCRENVTLEEQLVKRLRHDNDYNMFKLDYDLISI